MTSAAASPSLAALLADWRTQLQHWASSGAFTTAAREALQLAQVPAALQDLGAQLAADDMAGLPAVELLAAEAMGGALAAYAAGNGTIYLNASSLTSAGEHIALLSISNRFRLWQD